VVPDFSALSPSEDTFGEHPASRREGRVHLLIHWGYCLATPCRAADSTGIKREGEGEWNADKHGGPKRRVRRQVHIGIGKQTLDVRAVQITGSNTGDAPMLAHSLNRIPCDHAIGSVTADGAYDTRRCRNAIADRAAAAAIPPRRNAAAMEAGLPPVPSPETLRCAHRRIRAGHSGGTGADTAVGAASRRRCIV
jgi:transposase